ncbi:MAG: BatA domain-containing protein [Anaerolineae bacterium]
MIWRHPIGFGALAAVEVILWLHRRRRRVADALVPSLVPWRRSGRRAAAPTAGAAERAVGLHVLCAVLLAIALAGPERPGRPAPSGDLAIVVDTTLSMAAGDRWPAARAAVARAVAGAGGQVTLVALGAAPRVLAAPTGKGAPSWRPSTAPRRGTSAPTCRARWRWRCRRRALDRGCCS